MTDRELRHLSRVQLMEMLLAQEKEIELLRQQLDAANEALGSREINLLHAGSIAEASLRLNGVFEAAQAAAQQYLENIERLSRKLEARYGEKTNEGQMADETSNG